MTASPATPSAAARRPSSVPDGWTAAGAVAALGCTLMGQYVETPWKAGSGEWGVDFGGNGGWAALALLVVFVTVALLVVGLATARARALPPARTAWRALVLAVLGAVTIVVFWTGAPAVLAGGAAGLALDARRRAGRLPGTAVAAVALAVLTVAAALALAVAG
jgi:hypothetical protein